jgi:thiamine kinase-like enzyme
MKLITEILERGKLKPISKEGMGSTGEAHLAVLDGQKYLLRICPSEKVQRYINYYRKFRKYGFIPRLLERKNNYLLFEFIDGRVAHEHESPKVIKEVGKICAIINKLGARYSFKRERSFLEKLDEVKRKKVISQTIYDETLRLYKELKTKVKLKTSLDAGDVTSDNFMIGKNGRVYFVDIEAIKPNIKGMGIAKSFAVWFKKENEKEHFREGYKSIGSMDFYTDDYGKLATLLFFVQRIRFKANKEEMDVVRRTINKLERLLGSYI